MSDDSFDDDFNEDLNEVLNRSAINRRVQETVIRRNEPAQRTLMGGRLDQGNQAEYEEIRRDVTYGPTHHKSNAFDLNTFIYPSNLDMRDYQYDIIVKTFYKNLLCAIPTGMGKTFIASTVMLNYYRWFKEGKIIFMAPTRPLVAQQIQACLGVTDIPSGDTAILLDKTRKNRPEIWNSKRVFFTTPQVVENDLKAGILNPKDIVCLVIDEAHRARGNYAYTNVVQFIDRFNTSYRVLALTATPAADIEGVQEVVNNLHISQIEIRTEESIDIVKYMKRKETVRINVGLNSEMEDIIELLSEAIDPILKQANEANIYDVTDPTRINFFHVMQKSQSIIKNPTLNEGLKWKFYFILQVIGYVGQMLRRLKIYGLRTFYSYFQNKCKEFKTKYSMGKSTNKTSAGFFYHDALKKIEYICERVLADPAYVSHPKLEHMIDELMTFFQHKKNSRVIVFTELRESALEIVKCIDHLAGDDCQAHIFIGQSKAKEGFDEEEYTRKNAPKGRGKQKKQEREEREREALEKKQRDKDDAAKERAASRTATSEEAQLQGMNQKTQKELIKKFKKGDFNVLVATSIGEEGLDIGEVDLIICYDSTSSPIKNIQRMGRTGRKNDGKVILLLASNEELKFDQSMEGYAFVQKQIAQDCLDTHKSDRILPKEVQPRCIKKFIEIPEENLAIAKGEDEEEVIKYATQAMLGKTPKPKAVKGTKGQKQAKLPGIGKGKGKQAMEPPKAPKRFFMPDQAETGFVKSSKLVKKIGGESADTSRTSENTSISLDSDSDDDYSTSKENSKLLDTSTCSGKNGADSSLIKQQQTRFSKTLDGTKAEKKGKFFKPDINGENLVIQRKESDLGPSSDHEEKSAPVITSKIKEAPGKSGISEAQIEDDILDGLSDNEEEVFERPLTPEYEKADFLASSYRGGNQSDKEEDEVVDSGEDNGEEAKGSENEDEVVNSENERELELVGETDHLDERNTSLKRASDQGATLTSVSLKRSKTHDPDVLNSILSFKAFEEEPDDYYIQPYREAEIVMDKQYDEDPSFIEESSLEPSVKLKGKKPKSKTKTPSKSVKPKNDDQSTKKKPIAPVETTSPKMDITALLKNGPKSAAKRINKSRFVDLSALSNDQVIDLDNEEMISQDQPNVVCSRRRQKTAEIIYASQTDPIAPHIFSKDEGFLTESEKRQFFSEYYTSAEIEQLVINPNLGARRDIHYAKIHHSRIGQRFTSLVKMIRSPNARKLNKLVSQAKELKRINYSDEITDSDNIVDENQIEYVERKVSNPLEIEEDSDSGDSVLDTEGPGAAGFTSISLLSDDDDEFKSL